MKKKWISLLLALALAGGLLPGQAAASTKITISDATLNNTGEGDHTIGAESRDSTEEPKELESITVGAGTYPTGTAEPVEPSSSPEDVEKPAEPSDSPEDVVVEETTRYIFRGGRFSDDMWETEVPAGASITLPECMFDAPSGKTFAGWEDAGHPDRLLKPGEQFSTSANTEFYTFLAAWQDSTGAIGSSEDSKDGIVQVIFLPNNGTENMAVGEVERRAIFVFPECMFEAPEGQQFIAWARMEGDDPDEWQTYAPGDFANTEDGMVFHALWGDPVEEQKDEPAEPVVLTLDDVVSIDTAVAYVEQYAAGMTDAEKLDPDAIDRATLFAEEAAAKAATLKAPSGPFELSASMIRDTAKMAKNASSAVTDALLQSGVTPNREIPATVTVEVPDNNVEVKASKDLADTEADNVKINAPDFSIGATVSALMDQAGEAMKAKKDEKTGQVDVQIPKGASVTLGMKPKDDDPTYQAVVNQETGEAAPGKLNPATGQIESKASQSGAYDTQNNEKDFSDIATKSAEMQKAIKYLASQSIINGRTEQTFAPDDTINRAEIAKLLVKALGKLDNSAETTFADVKKSNWYYSVAASSQKHGLIKGYQDNTFQGTTPISKVQIVAVASRVLVTEAKYKTPANVSKILSRYSDTIPNWSKNEVALATNANLVIPRADGTFSGSGNMTRGDAAVIIYRMFMKIW